MERMIWMKGWRGKDVEVNDKRGERRKEGYGLLNDLDLVTCCRIGSVMGAFKVAVQGPQNHTPTFDEIQERFKAVYGYRF